MKHKEPFGKAYGVLAPDIATQLACLFRRPTYHSLVFSLVRPPDRLPCTFVYPLSLSTSIYTTCIRNDISAWFEPLDFTPSCEHTVKLRVPNNFLKFAIRLDLICASSAVVESECPIRTPALKALLVFYPKS